MLDDTRNVHDVAALLKEFFRDMKDSLLPDDLYMSFLLTASESLPCWSRKGNSTGFVGVWGQSSGCKTPPPQGPKAK